MELISRYFIYCSGYFILFTNRCKYNVQQTVVEQHKVEVDVLQIVIDS